MSATFRMPAEWEKQEATWLAWPHNNKDWPDKFEPIPWVFCEMIRHITAGQRLRLLVKDKKTAKAAKDCCERAGIDVRKIDFYTIPTDRGWMRDCGPIFVKDGVNKKYLLNWKFTGWAKYANYRLDDQVPNAIGGKLVTPMHKGKHVVLEGGAIDVNGKGTLLTTEECLLSKVQERNLGFKRDDYEAVFEKYLGISHVIWLGNGITGDDTHGHVDDLTRFVNYNTVVTVVEKNRRDKNHAPLQDNLKRLWRARDQNGKPLNVVELPMPKPLIFEGTQLPASYANFLITNQTVLVPTFNDAHDRVALNILAELFPKHDVIGIHAVDLVWGFGTLHCLSQQEPV